MDWDTVSPGTEVSIAPVPMLLIYSVETANLTVTGRVEALTSLQLPFCCLPFSLVAEPVTQGMLDAREEPTIPGTTVTLAEIDIKTLRGTESHEESREPHIFRSGRG